MLVLQLTHRRIIKVGSLGRIRFVRGYYAYVGSARRGMRSRVARHLAREKRKRWHIDWLTTQPGVVPIAVASTMLTSLECRIAAALSSRAHMRVDGFGCSDCECESHLFCFSSTDGLFSALENLKRYGVPAQQSEGRHRTTEVVPIGLVVVWRAGRALSFDVGAPSCEPEKWERTGGVQASRAAPPASELPSGVQESLRPTRCISPL